MSMTAAPLAFEQSAQELPNPVPEGSLARAFSIVFLTTQILSLAPRKDLGVSPLSRPDDAPAGDDIVRAAGKLPVADRRVKLHPRGVAALTGLSRIIDNSGAKKLIDQAVDVDPTDPRPLLERARRGTPLSHDPAGDARSALFLDPTLWEAHLFLAEYEAQAGKLDAAVSHLGVVLDVLPERRDLTSGFARSCMIVATSGDVDLVKRLLLGHENGGLVEPLVVAVRMLSGENPIVAKEVEEVARDILKIPEEITARQQV